MKLKQGLTYDDVLLIPRYSEVEHRADIDLSVELPKGIKLDIPIVSANMKTITGPEMAIKIAELGGLALLHRFVNSTQEYIDLYKSALLFRDDLRIDESSFLRNIGISIGVNGVEDEALDHIVSDLKCKIVCVDVAHGDHIKCVRTVERINKNYPHVLLIAGNVATWDGAQKLYEAGADVIKCGIGPGSQCSTRTQTGNGIPQLTALDDIYEWSLASGAAHHRSTKPFIIADGGLKNSGDVTKGLCFSHAVMLGSLLSGTDEAPGELCTIDGIQYKTYAGSSTHKANHVEGVVSLSPIKGPVKLVIEKLLEGLRSGMSYQGARNLEELRKDPEFVQISNAGLVESHPHSFRILK